MQMSLRTIAVRITPVSPIMDAFLSLREKEEQQEEKSGIFFKLLIHQNYKGSE